MCWRRSSLSNGWWAFNAPSARGLESNIPRMENWQSSVQSRRFSIMSELYNQHFDVEKYSNTVLSLATHGRRRIRPRCTFSVTFLPRRARLPLNACFVANRVFVHQKQSTYKQWCHCFWVKMFTSENLSATILFAWTRPSDAPRLAAEPLPLIIVAAFPSPIRRLVECSLDATLRAYNQLMRKKKTIIQVNPCHLSHRISAPLSEMRNERNEKVEMCNYSGLSCVFLCR